MNPLRSKRSAALCQGHGGARFPCAVARAAAARADLPSLVLGLLLSAISLSCAVPAAAQEPEPAPASPTPTTGASGPVDGSSSDVAPGPALQYERAIAQAVDEHERGHFEEAREHFREAHALQPSARTLRGLGKVEFELRNYGESVHFLQAALASDVKALPADLHEEVARLLERARAYVGEIHVDVQPGTASVSVDGVSVASGPEASLSLQIGSHMLEFRADGRLPERRLVTVRGRDQINIQVVLNPLEGAPALPPLGSDPLARRDTHRRKAWLWSAAGAVVVAAAVGIGVAVHNHNKEDGAPYGGSTGFVLRNP